MENQFPSLNAEASRYKKPKGVALKYGTAGFRMKASLMESTAFRMGLLAILRSRHQNNAAIGICMTASHNPEQDNGIKIADPDGGVLHMSWEKHAGNLANADDVAQAVSEISKSENVQNNKGSGVVFVARDTRKSGEKLVELAREAALLLRGNVVDYGVLTTPQLHQMVRFYNKGDKDAATESGYFKRLGDAFRRMIATTPKENEKKKRGALVLDGAHGVGAKKCKKMQEALGSTLKLELRNDVGAGALNKDCGADHVYRKKVPPHGVKKTSDAMRRMASFDGDADRVVYHYFDKSGEWHLLDGDKIAALFADFLGKEVKALGLSDDAAPTLAIVQNSYANGASTSFMKDKMGVPVRFGKTGVKHLHKIAHQFDIGVYFEANGHGTVLFSKRFDDMLLRLQSSNDESVDMKRAVERLSAARMMINQSVGDAFSDMLFVEAILHVRGWTISDWNKIYVNTPSRQSTVQVPDRTVVIPNSTERRVLGPAGLQEAIDALVEKAESPARAFVRPSGTEDIVRVYAEAKTQEGADKLAQAVADAVTKFAGGGNSDSGSNDSGSSEKMGDDDAKEVEASSKM